MGPAKVPAASSQHESKRATPPVTGIQNPQEQADLFSGLQSFTANSPVQIENSDSSSSETANFKKPTGAVLTNALPQLALEDAYRILKVGAGDTWEKIEAARQSIVLRSSPILSRGLHSDQVQKLLADTKMANDAVVVVAARRSGRQ